MFYRITFLIFMCLSSMIAFAEGEDDTPSRRMSSAVYTNPISVANNYEENKAQKEKMGQTTDSAVLVKPENKPSVTAVTAEPTVKSTETSSLSSNLGFNWLYLAIAGGLLLFIIPLITILRQRKELKNKIHSFEKEISEARELTHSVQNKYEQIKNDIEAIKHNQTQTEDVSSLESNKIQTVEQNIQIESQKLHSSSDTLKESELAVTDAIQTQALSLAEQLRQEAIVLGQNAATEAEHLRAFTLWQAVMQMEQNQQPEVYFKAALQAQHLFENAKTQEQQQQYFNQAEQWFKLALVHQPPMYEAAYALANLLFNKIKLLLAQERSAEIGELWQQAEQAFHYALEIKPKAYEAANSIGLLFSSQGRFLSSHNQLDEARLAWQKAEDNYRLALDIEPNSYTVLYNLGNLLLNQAQLYLVQEQVTEVEAKWAQAEECYKKALALNPEDYEVANNLGILLLNEAIFLVANERIDEAEEKWQQVEQCYHRALALKEDELQFVLNLVYMYMHWYQARKHSHPALATQKLDAARQLIKQFIQSQPQHQGALAYDLACIESLSGRFVESIQQLAICLQIGRLSSREQIEQDEDLLPVVNSEEFKAWAANVFSN